MGEWTMAGFEREPSLRGRRRLNVFERFPANAVEADGRRREDVMPIWELKPIDPESDAWQGSRHRETVIVRAKPKWEARDVAKAAFSAGSLASCRGTIPLQPWIHASLTTCWQIAAMEIDEDGPSGVLVPAGQVFGFGRM